MNPLYPQSTLLEAPTLAPDWSIWALAYCQADMPYDLFGGSGPFSNKGTIKIPMIIGGADNQVAELNLAGDEKSRRIR